MKMIHVFFWGLLFALTGLWLLADSLLPQPFSYFAFRSVFVQYSGILGIGVMSVAMVLALRPRLLEQGMDGLDKVYRLHKWLGIAGLLLAVMHWWMAQGSKWMVGWGWLERPRRHARPTETLSALETWFRGQRELAESLGEWAFYAAVILLLLALTKRFPYHLFTKTHKWLAVVYLVLVYHSIILTNNSYWLQPIGIVLALLLSLGTVAAMLILAGRIGAGRKVRGVIDRLQYYPALRVLETEITLEPGWPGHSAGQFAFVTSDRREGAHPYTLASSWDAETRRVRIVTKALGDHTSRLRHKLQVGLPVTVEGPYGCFDFNDEQPRQIWIGAGIGITPFIAQMNHLAHHPDNRPVDLFHPTADFDQTALDKLTADAHAAGIGLHILVDEFDGRLDAKSIRTLVPDWRQASVWFCGPPAFGHALRKDLLAHGLAAKHFHQELFQMR